MTNTKTEHSMMDGIELKWLEGWGCHTLYSITGKMNGTIEVQFDNGIFNGKILFADDAEDELLWEELKDEEIFKYVKQVAEKDYLTDYLKDKPSDDDRIKKVTFLKQILTESEYLELAKNPSSLEEALALYSISLIESVIIISIDDARFVMKKEDLKSAKSNPLPIMQRVSQLEESINPIFVEIDQDGTLIFD